MVQVCGRILACAVVDDELGCVVEEYHLVRRLSRHSSLWAVGDARAFWARGFHVPHAWYARAEGIVVIA